MASWFDTDVEENSRHFAKKIEFYRIDSNEKTKQDSALLSGVSEAKDELLELEGGDGIILEASGRLKMPIIEQISVLMADPDVDVRRPCNIFCSCKRDEISSIINCFYPPSWNTFIPPTPGLILRNLDYAALHDEMHDLNTITKKIYDSARSDLNKFKEYSNLVLLLCCVFSVFSFIMSFYSLSMGEIAAVFIFLILCIVAYITVILGSRLQYWVIQNRALTAAKVVNRNMLDYIDSSLNHRYPRIEWKIDKKANIFIKCIPMDSLCSIVCDDEEGVDFEIVVIGEP